MKLFQPRKERVSVTFLVPVYEQGEGGGDAQGHGSDPLGEFLDYQEVEREFFVREKLRPQAAAFLALLNQVSASSSLEEQDQLLDKLLLHVLSHPADGGPRLTKEDLDRIPDSERVALLDLQGDIYGFRKEDERLGKKFAPLVEAISALKSRLQAARMTPGRSSSTPSPVTTESTPVSQSDAGPTDSSTGTTVSAFGESGDETNSNAD